MIDISYETELGYQWSSIASQLKPIVALRISTEYYYQDTAALVDSGADYSIFDAEFAEILGLNLTNGRRKALIGLDGKKHYGYLHRIQIEILDAPRTWKHIDVEVIFRPNHPKELGNLLGRHDFFDALRIGFDERRQIIYLGHV